MVPVRVRAELPFSVLPAPRFGPERIQVVLASEIRSLEPARVSCARLPRARQPETHMTRLSPLQGAPPAARQGKKGPQQRRSQLAPHRARQPHTHRTARKLRSHLSRAPPEASDRRAQAAAASGPLSRPACNEQPPARARVTLLQYTASAASIEVTTLRLSRKSSSLGHCVA